MKAVIQRVRSASVSVDGKQVSAIGRGLMVLIGIGVNDTANDLAYVAGKILALRLFPEQGHEDWGWKKSVVDAEFEVLCVSQFTLMSNTKKGSKPDFHAAMPGETSRQMYDTLLEDLRAKYKPERIQDGRFGEMMVVSLTNDGPVTIIIDSSDAPAPQTSKVTTSNELKAKRKEELAVKAKEKLERLEAAKAAGDKGEKLAERFKEAMMEGY